MPNLLAEIHNIFLFVKCIVEVAFFTGLALVPLIVIGYELQTKRRF
jgi:hypothetical protein